MIGGQSGVGGIFGGTGLPGMGGGMGGGGGGGGVDLFGGLGGLGPNPGIMFQGGPISLPKQVCIIDGLLSAVDHVPVLQQLPLI